MEELYPCQTFEGCTNIIQAYSLEGNCSDVAFASFAHNGLRVSTNDPFSLPWKGDVECSPHKLHAAGEALWKGRSSSHPQKAGLTGRTPHLRIGTQNLRSRVRLSWRTKPGNPSPATEKRKHLKGCFFPVLEGSFQDCNWSSADDEFRTRITGFGPLEFRNREHGDHQPVGTWRTGACLPKQGQRGLRAQVGITSHANCATTS